MHAPQLDTTAEGLAHNRFWVVDLKGRKLTPGKAEQLAERLLDYVRYCTPTTNALNATHFKSESVEVCNSRDPDYTIVTIQYADPDPSTLLQIASVLTGIGLDIAKATIQASRSSKAAEVGAAAAANERFYRFSVQDAHGQKLGYSAIHSLLFVMDLLLSKSKVSARPPLAAASLYVASDSDSEGC